MDPSHILGIIFSFLAAGIGFFVAKDFYARYHEGKALRMLYVFLDFICVGFASTSLAMEKIFLILFQDGTLGIIAGYHALVFSGIAIVFQGLYVVDVVFPKKIKIFALIFSSMVTFYLILASIGFPTPIPVMYEIEFPWYVGIATLFTTALILSLNAIILFYYSIKVKIRSL